MLVPFYENTLASTFIKNLLTATPLPIYPIVRDGDYLLKDLVYMYKNRVIRCTKAGVVNTKISTLQVDFSYNSDKLYGNTPEASFVVLSVYEFGKYYINITEKKSLENSFYDAETHRSLRTYLECLRAFHRINLFNFYNCFCGEEFDDMYIDPSISGDYNTDTDDGNKDCFPICMKESKKFKVLAVPIKYDTKYTIYMKTATSSYIMPILKSDAGYIQIKRSNVKTAKSLFSETFHPKKINEIRFDEPYVYEGVSTHAEGQTNGELLHKYEKYLYLLIQVPRNNTSSVIVIEGDNKYKYDEDNNPVYYSQPKISSYSNETVMKNGSVVYEDSDKQVHLSDRVIINADDSMPRLIDIKEGFSNRNMFMSVSDFLQNMIQADQDKIYRSRSSLLFVNDSSSYAFDDILLQYLLHNVITNREWIPDNIGRVQEILPNNTYLPDVWDDKLRLEVYNKLNSDKNIFLQNVTGFIDSAAEKYLYMNKDRIIK